MPGHFFLHAPTLLHRATKWNHDFQIGQPHLVPYFFDRPALQGKSFLIPRVIIPTGPPKSNHRIFLLRLIRPAANQTRIFIALEITQAQNDFSRVKSRRQHGHPSRQRLHKKLRFVLIS